jgi:hypothetical protein
MKLLSLSAVLICGLGLSLNYFVLLASDADRSVKAFGMPVTIIALAAVAKIFEDKEGDAES